MQLYGAAVKILLIMSRAFSSQNVVNTKINLSLTGHTVLRLIGGKEDEFVRKMFNVNENSLTVRMTNERRQKHHKQYLQFKF